MTKTMELSWRVYGAGIVALGIVGFVWGDFVSGQPVPKWFPDRAALAYAAAAFMLVAGLGMQVRRTVVWAAAALALYYTLIVFVLMNGRVIFANYAVFGAYSGAAEPLAIAAGAWIVTAMSAELDAARAALLARIARFAFGICAVLFGLAHFAYMEYTAPLVPAWLPPGQVFWGYATGVFHILGGLAILGGVQARLAAHLLAAMYAAFLPLVFVPVLVSETASAFRWTECATTIALVGTAWIVADSLKRREGDALQASL
ncbi:MAG TPA: hypothetical protein VG889_11060 [Rhizomicrobium sp.]|nr:hypothetical protein [Rhizomicrobium sp.]